MASTKNLDYFQIVSKMVINTILRTVCVSSITSSILKGSFKVSRMTNLVHCVTFQLLLMDRIVDIGFACPLYSRNSLLVFAVSGWKAVPANQAMYSLRSAHYGPTEGLVDDEALPRTEIHSIYKFGWCTPDSIQKVFLRKTANITLSDWQSTQASYLYLLEDGDTIDHRLACIVMTVYVPRIHMFRLSRIPVYYCQGDLHLVYKMTFTRLDIHEFYLHQKLNIPANFFFHFYHPPRL